MPITIITITAMIITMTIITIITMLTATITMATTMSTGIHHIPMPTIRTGHSDGIPMRRSEVMAGRRSASSPSPLMREGQGGGEAPARRQYLREPDAIYRQSFALIRAEAKLDHLPPAVAEVAVRLIHACGMPDIVDDLAFTPDLPDAARAALAGGAPIFCDAAMVASGIMRRRLPATNDLLCMLDDPRVPALAQRLGTTRSAAAVELWRDRLAGAVVAIGNAPTALFHLLELIEAGGPRPAAILAFPVGFVGAAESKEALIAAGLDVPYLTLRGRRGGSALATAAVNAVILGEATP
jgi:precorrin-8X/cobalt-precorrin-8 methylmutase